MGVLQKPELFARMMNPDYLTTPAEVTDAIRAACAEVAPGQEPVFVPLVQHEGMLVQDCHNNVPKLVAASGGSLVNGWTIWEAPDLLLEFEFHAVWRSPEGDLQDLTPKPDGEERILFLPDPDKTFDFGGEVLHSNRCFPLSDDPAIVETVKFQQKFAEKKMRVETDIRLGKRPPTALGDLFREALMETIPDKMPKPQPTFDFDDVRPIGAPIGRRIVGRNDPCPCGSGKKFKKCCIPR